MPFGLMIRLGPINHVLRRSSYPHGKGQFLRGKGATHVLVGVQIVPRKVAIFRGKDMPGHARLHSAVSCTKMAEPIEMPFGLWTRVGPR